ncbi:hypothetical protein L2E82_17008 [Cichorium intybus]|uniref:Uncharacterized protein n=1 Tax=Cichorium intybus TaxID=13427 RepID=A0ACB9F6K4_CICIN|nr:hypothetical protein L2E82_17008 [Cichorium intybus]
MFLRNLFLPPPAITRSAIGLPPPTVGESDAIGVPFRHCLLRRSRPPPPPPPPPPPHPTTPASSNYLYHRSLISLNEWCYYI